MQIAQKLYEGIEVSTGVEGLISYMRTDSTRLSDAFVSNAIQYIQNEYGKEYAGKVRICLENVFEETPDMLTDIIKAVNDPRLGMCLDIGHVNAYSKLAPLKWLEDCAPYIYHYHIHNNSADFDSHSALSDGTIPMKELLTAAGALTPDATKALEVLEAAPSVNWLIENEFIEA